MNDEHRQNVSGNGRSSHTENGSTATAEAVDRRWFEEALRSQGFLVEPPALEDEDIWRTPSGVPPTSLGAGPDDEPLPVEPLEVDGDPELRSPAAVAEATPQSPGPEPKPGTEPEPMIDTAQPDPQPWDLGVPAVVAAPAAPDPVWPTIGQTPGRMAAVPAVVPAAAGVARQPVAPTTLAAGSSPVPSSSLAARLSRSAPSPAVETVPEPATPAVARDESAVAVLEAPSAPPPAPASTPPDELSTPPAELSTPPAQLSAPPEHSVPPAVLWALPADEAVPTLEQPAISSIPLIDDEHRDITTASVVAAAAVSGIEVPDVVDASSAEETARAEADLQAQTIAQASSETEASPEPVTADPVTPTLAATAEAVAAPSTPFKPPASGIATVAPRPPAATVATTVDGGDSDLWGLVSDPRKAAAAVGDPTVEAPASRATTIALTLIVAFVVVALVLGFLYLVGQLL